MEKWISSHPHLTAVVAALSVIAVGIGLIIFLMFLGLSPMWIVIIASAAAVATGIPFFYGARNSGKANEKAERSTESNRLDMVEAPQLEPAKISSSTLVEGRAEATSEPIPDSTGKSLREGKEIVPSPSPDITQNASPEVSEGISIKEEQVESDVIATSETQPAIPEEAALEPIAAVEKVMSKLEDKVEHAEIAVIGSDDLSQISGQKATVTKEAAEPSSVAAVDPTKQQIIKKAEQRCVIISAPSTGVLQDRLNNWLSGGTGRVVHASMASDQKGFYLTIFYEPL